LRIVCLSWGQGRNISTKVKRLGKIFSTFILADSEILSTYVYEMANSTGIRQIGGYLPSGRLQAGEAR
jgi:hypothetical protein